MEMAGEEKRLSKPRLRATWKPTFLLTPWPRFLTGPSAEHQVPESFLLSRWEVNVWKRPVQCALFQSCPGWGLSGGIPVCGIPE